MGEAGAVGMVVGCELAWSKIPHLCQTDQLDL